MASQAAETGGYAKAKALGTEAQAIAAKAKARATAKAGAEELADMVGRVAQGRDDVVCSVLAAGASGVGKSTIGNVMLFKKMALKEEEGGLKVSGGAESCTQEPRERYSQDRKKKFTDVPGIPDTNPRKTKTFYDMTVDSAKMPLSALFFVFKYDRVDLAKFQQAGLLFREVKRVVCPKVLVINDMIDRDPVDSDEEENNPAPTESDFKKVALEITVATGIEFDLVVPVYSKKLFKRNIAEAIALYLDTPPIPSPFLNSYEGLKTKCAQLRNGANARELIVKEKLQEIDELQKVQDNAIAGATATAAVAVSATVLSFFTFGATLGIAGYTSVAAGAVISKALFEKNKLEEKRKQIQNEDSLQELERELERCVEQFEKLEADLDSMS